MIELLHVDCMEYMDGLPDKAEAAKARFASETAQQALF